ncbi:MAG: methyltransferase domain-containing protein [Bauldia sp.]|nr:methyltransferase domain-containing protein [Bauldia sp.]
MKDDGGWGYVLGHTDGELGRLERQAAIFSEATEDVLRRAGIGPGMKVLDVGCGVGDVSMIAAALVGPGGSVVGIDQAAEGLGLATRRAEAAGFDWLGFRQADVHAIDGSESFDAVVGRFILMHLPDRAAGLRGITRAVRPGGVVAFIEMDITSATSQPPFPLLTRCMDWIIDLYAEVGVEAEMGSKLYGTFRAAGLTPTMVGNTRVEAGPDALAYDYVAESIRSLAPLLERRGIATAAEMDVDTLSERLRRDALAGDHCFVFPRLIGAWATKA